MAQFLDPKSLKKEIKLLFSEAESSIMIVSPYIKLDESLIDCLKKHMKDPQFKIDLLFGKNKYDISKSLSVFDIEFFKQFQNVDIRYNENLHAKYYANENKSIITSLNLYSFSFKNNIEAGVLFERRFGANIANMLSSNLARDFNSDEESYKYFDSVFEESEVVFIKNAKETKSFFGLVSSFKGNVIEVDETKNIYKEKSGSIKFESKTGFCIRTGVKIEFNFKVPFSKDAYKSWNQYKNKIYPEKFCHYSGEKSDGETCFETPVLRKYYSDLKFK